MILIVLSVCVAKFITRTSPHNSLHSLLAKLVWISQSKMHQMCSNLHTSFNCDAIYQSSAKEEGRSKVKPFRLRNVQHITVSKWKKNIWMKTKALVWIVVVSNMVLHSRPILWGKDRPCKINHPTTKLATFTIFNEETPTVYHGKMQSLRFSNA